MAEDLKLLVLDALDGKPQANVEVEYFCTGLPRNSAHTTTITNNEGFASVLINRRSKLPYLRPIRKSNAAWVQ
jgi:5-hydroxyisourate hydrolase-like protein (transthyretin family)